MQCLGDMEHATTLNAAKQVEKRAARAPACDAAYAWSMGVADCDAMYLEVTDRLLVTFLKNLML